jgi:hypothetical protein
MEAGLSVQCKSVAGDARLFSTQLETSMSDQMVDFAPTSNMMENTHAGRSCLLILFDSSMLSMIASIKHKKSGPHRSLRHQAGEKTKCSMSCLPHHTTLVHRTQTIWHEHANSAQKHGRQPHTCVLPVTQLVFRVCGRYHHLFELVPDHAKIPQHSIENWLIQSRIFQSSGRHGSRWP